MTNAAQMIAEQICASPELKALAADLIKLAFKPEIKRDALYTCNEAATLTGTSRSTIQRAVEAERLKADYTGSELRIRGAAILQWLDEGGKTGRSRRDLIREAGE
jgi:excisionase family DNA binding protein